MKNKFRKLMIVLVACFTFASFIDISVNTYADAYVEEVEEIDMNEVLKDYRTVNWECGGFKALVSPYIMARRNRRFKDNNDFMIVLVKGGEFYTGNEVKVKVVKDTPDSVIVKVVKIKGVSGSKKLFKDSDEIEFFKNAPEEDTDEEDDEDEDDDDSQSENSWTIIIGDRKEENK